MYIHSYSCVSICMHEQTYVYIHVSQTLLSPTDMCRFGLLERELSGGQPLLRGEPRARNGRGGHGSPGLQRPLPGHDRGGLSFLAVSQNHMQLLVSSDIVLSFRWRGVERALAAGMQVSVAFRSSESRASTDSCPGPAMSLSCYASRLAPVPAFRRLNTEYWAPRGLLASGAV